MMKALRVFVLTIAAVTASFGATLFNNGALNNLNGNLMSELRQAEDFTLSELSNLTSITFFSLEADGAYTGSIDWSIYSGAGNQPGILVGGGNATPTRNNLGAVIPLDLDAYQNTFSVNLTNLAASSYWLVLHNGPVATTEFSDFYWGWTDLNAVNTPTIRGLEQSLAPPSLTWDDTGNEHAFFISGDPASGIPEPATVILLSTGLAALWFGKRSRARSSEDR
jgi:hypothetical protein